MSHDIKMDRIAIKGGQNILKNVELKYTVVVNCRYNSVL